MSLVDVHEAKREADELDVPSSRTWQFAKDSIPDDSYGVLDEAVVTEVRDDLLEALLARNIDPSTVVFSGYGGRPHEKEDAFLVANRIKYQLSEVGRAANAAYAAGKFDDNPGLRESYTAKIAQLKADLAAASEAGTVEYHFAGVDNLSSGPDTQDNPIHFATLVQPTIGVYDPDLLPDAPDFGGTVTVDSSPADVEAALIMRYHPRYVDEAGEPLSAD